ncbi:M15 family metallopeptidase [Mycobacterium sp. KBS0706]|uniref:M15 family metallopeptidase n=1 Tax=Mycobacterium sp. KBS0706 TaxID=2578109 RepID=UPI00110F76F7|nr:M15 family metallopeptidase [Mycobacterium sp. KBS0706]TSD86380.1 M15 family metallopeptidase [Mycobacterium sp. KBS0706]
MNYLEKIPVPPHGTFNLGLTAANNKGMVGFFGHPVIDGKYRPDGKCTTANSPPFKKLLATRNVGPFALTGIKPALDAIEAIFLRVKAEQPALYAILQTEGMLCCRFTKIKQKNGTIKIGPNVSNHSWGTAVDIKLAGSLDTQGDGFTQRGLLVLSAYFNAAGWFWGAAFPVEDAMHFEVSRSLLSRWQQSGLI